MATGHWLVIIIGNCLEPQNFISSKGQVGLSKHAWYQFWLCVCVFSFFSKIGQQIILDSKYTQRLASKCSNKSTSMLIPHLVFINFEYKILGVVPKTGKQIGTKMQNET